MMKRRKFLLGLISLVSVRPWRSVTPLAPAASFANTLEDYEEGYWVPIAQDILGEWRLDTITPLPDTSSGWYMKIGRKIRVEAKGRDSYRKGLTILS